MVEQIQSCNIGTIFKNFEVVYGQHGTLCKDSLLLHNIEFMHQIDSILLTHFILTGSGKSHYIRDCIKKHKENLPAGADPAKFVKILSINETFNKMQFVKRFRNDSLDSFDVLIYLNINLVWPQVCPGIYY